MSRIMECSEFSYPTTLYYSLKQIKGVTCNALLSHYSIMLYAEYYLDQFVAQCLWITAKAAFL